MKKFRKADLALGLLFFFIGIICLAILLFPYIRETIFNFLKSLAPRELTDVEESMINRAFTFFSVTGLILSIIAGALILFEESIIAAMTQNIFPLSYFTVSLAALIIRLPGMRYLSSDYITFIETWISHLAANNHLFGIYSISSNYTPFYLFILGLISYLPESLWLIGVKLTSCLFDFFLAVTCGKIVFLITDKRERALVAYSAILLCPTVFMNSSIWAQCDSIYVCLMFLSLLLFIKRKNKPALFIYGIALSIKLQAIFMFPFIFVLYLYNRFKIRNICFLILGFISSPIIGFPFGAPKQFIKAFSWQLIDYSGFLTSTSSIYALFHIRDEFIPLITNVGIVFTMGFVICFVLYVLYNRSGYVQCKEYSDISSEGTRFVILFFFFTLVIPFLLPKMHVRYFFAAEVASIIFAVLFPRRWWITLIIILPGCATYFNYLFANTTDLFYLAIIMLFGVLLVTRWTIDSIRMKPAIYGDNKKI
jgi:Gpi18-like mannosyltransferase